MDWRKNRVLPVERNKRTLAAVEEAEDKTQHKRCKCKNKKKRNEKITFLHILGHYIA